MCSTCTFSKRKFKDLLPNNVLIYSRDEINKNAKANSSKTGLVRYQCPVSIPTDTFLFKADNLIRAYYIHIF